MKIILSSPILIEDGDFTRKTISKNEALAWVAENDPVNFNGHQTTKILGVKLAIHREAATHYDEALILSPRQRLRSMREYTKEEIEAIGVDFVLITKK